jgi:ribosomal protein S18 acetylase RimI-like enzyme
MFDAPEYRRGMFVACTLDSGYESDTIIGYCSIDTMVPPSFKIVENIIGPQPKPSIHELAVMSLHRRKGVARLLMSACEAWAVSRGFGTVYVSVEKSNDAALRLYERLGYVKAKLTEVRPDSYHRKRMQAKFIWLEKRIDFN